MARPTRPPRSSRAFGLDAEQADAILELKVYRLARLEILIIRRELADKRERQAEIVALLGDEPARWALVRSEIAEVQKVYSDTRADRRRTTFASDDEVVEYDAEAFIIDEDNVVVVSRDGWIKRQKEVKDPATTRLREGDEILAAVGGSTRATLVLFTTHGVAYTCRIIDVPASTGYGEPVQRFFKFKDGERVVAVMSLDPRVSPGLQPKAEGETPPRHALAATSDGYALRFSLAPFIEPSTRAGRKFVKLPDGVEVVGVSQVTGERDDHRRDARGAGDAVPGRRGQRALGAGARRHPHQDRRRQGSAPRLHRLARRPRSDGRRDVARRRADHQHRQVRGHLARRQGTRTAAARLVHARRATAAAGHRACRNSRVPLADPSVVAPTE